MVDLGLRQRIIKFLSAVILLIWKVSMQSHLELRFFLKVIKTEQGLFFNSYNKL